jgi:protein-disulfide isomerase
MVMSRFINAVLFVSLAGASALSAQTSLPPGQVGPFKDTSMLKPPAGSKVAIVEWEDLECPACAHAFPIVHAAAAHYKIPIVRYDFQIPGHIWSHEAAIYARYLQDKVSPVMAEDYRRQVFASQYQIGSKDDLHNFTTKFFQSKGQQVPFVIDPTGQFAKESAADTALGMKLNLQHTPTLLVVTATRWIDVEDISQLDSAIDAAMAQTSAAPAAAAKAPVVHHTAAKKAS